MIVQYWCLPIHPHLALTFVRSNTHFLFIYLLTCVERISDHSKRQHVTHTVAQLYNVTAYLPFAELQRLACLARHRLIQLGHGVLRLHGQTANTAAGYFVSNITGE